MQFSPKIIKFIGLRGVEFELIDTGGISVVESKKEIEKQVQRKVLSMMDEALALVLVLVW